MIFCAKWQNYGFGLYGRLFKVKACKIVTVMDNLLNFADAASRTLDKGRCPVSLFLFQGCKKP